MYIQKNKKKVFVTGISFGECKYDSTAGKCEETEINRVV